MRPANFTINRVPVALFAVLLACLAFGQARAVQILSLGDLLGGPFFSSAYSLSDDGSAVVGYSRSGAGNEAFRWTTSSGLTALGDLAGGIHYSAAWAASQDGSRLAGVGNSAGGFEAFVWDEATGMTGLGDLAGGSFYSSANAISADGQVVVGIGSSASGYEAFRWDAVNGMTGLGDLAGGSFFSVAYGVSGDGSVIVGASSSALTEEAFYWTETSGMRTLLGLLQENGADTGHWLALTSAHAVSADGRYIVGEGYNQHRQREAFLVDLLPRVRRAVPDGGATALLLALGGTGIAFARRRAR